MYIGVVTLTHNEERIMPWFLRHYAEFVDEIVVHDNKSTDSTLAILSQCPKVKVIPYDTGGQMRDDIHTQIKNEYYQTTNWDWAIIVDADELAWHPVMRVYLQECSERGWTIPGVSGFDMIGDGWPHNDGKSQLWEKENRGVPASLYTKWCVVPRKMQMRYSPGCHCANPTGLPIVGTPSAEIKLLHYKWIDRAYTMARMADTNTKLSPLNRQCGWGIRDLVTEEAYYERAKAARKCVFL